MSMIIKCIGGAMTLVSASLLGFYLSQAIAFRLDDLKQLKKILVVLRGEIKYSISTLPDALESISTRTNNQYRAFFTFLSKELKKFDGNNFQSIWEKAIEEHLNDTYLNKKDIEKLKQLGETLGFLDKEMQLNSINLYLEQLGEEIKVSIEDSKQNQKLYKNIGVLGGLLLIIIFI